MWLGRIRRGEERERERKYWKKEEKEGIGGMGWSTDGES